MKKIPHGRILSLNTITMPKKVKPDGTKPKKEITKAVFKKYCEYLMELKLYYDTDEQVFYKDCLDFLGKFNWEVKESGIQATIKKVRDDTPLT